MTVGLASMAGLPQIVVPAGIASGGHPQGLGFLGPAFSEPVLLGWAHAYEQGTMHRRPPPGYSELP